MVKLTRRQYQEDFIQLTKCFANGSIDTDDYKTLLSRLMDNYRKDYQK